MALVAENVRVGVTGVIYGGPDGTALPTTAVATPNVAFTDLGYISDDGVTEGQNSSITKIKAWQNGDIVRTVQTEHSATYHFTMIESKDAVFDVFYGPSSIGVIQVTGAQGVRQEWIIDVVDGSDKIRIVIPDGQVIERGDVVYKGDTAIGYEVTIEAYPDSSGVKAYKYLSGPDS